MIGDDYDSFPPLCGHCPYLLKLNLSLPLFFMDLKLQMAHEIRYVN